MWLAKLFQKRFEGHSSSTPSKTRHGTAPSWRRLRLEPLEERTLLSVGFDPLRVGVWTEERIDDLGVWVESQTWPDVFGYDGAPMRDEVTQLLRIPMRSDPRGGYQTIMRIDMAPWASSSASRTIRASSALSSTSRTLNSSTRWWSVCSRIALSRSCLLHSSGVHQTKRRA